MLAYPKGLPLPLREGYGFTPVSPLIRSELRSGRVRQRRRFTSVPTVASVSWIMSDAQAQFFEAWFEEVLGAGVSWFECPLKTPLGLDRYQARFADIYSGPELVGVSSWRFTASLELLKRPLLPPGWVTDAPDYILGSDIIDIAVNDKWPEFHEDPSQIILANDGVREDMKAWYQRQELDE
ncbi:hypothetical protein CBL13_01411 [Pseudomonas putida]|jgi:hypothetical protein|nr:hypothetical protein CBL13_01411 [Pseudomonas putida]